MELSQVGHGQYFNSDVFSGEYGASRRNITPRFFKESVLNEARSREAGRQLYDEVERVQFLIGGDKYHQPVRRVTNEIKARFPDEYAAFKRGEEVCVSGTPVDTWPPLNRTQVLNLKQLNILSVEQLAEASDATIQAIGIGGRTLVKQAIAFIETAKNGAVPLQLVERTEQAEARSAQLEGQMNEILQRLDALARENETLRSINTARPETVNGNGESGIVQEMSNPNILGTVQGVAIPREWMALKSPEMKSLASKVSAAPIVTKDDAIAAIQEAIDSPLLSA